MAVAQNQFSMAEKIFATSIVQGGPAPACFSPAAVDMLVYNEVRSKVQLSDIVDAEVQTKMRRVHTVTVLYECMHVKSAYEGLRSIVD